MISSQSYLTTNVFAATSGSFGDLAAATATSMTVEQENILG
jgi:hypothetical protein